MKFSRKWWVIVALLFVFAATVSFFAAQTEEPSTVNGPNGSEVQSENIEVQSSSDEPGLKYSTLEPSTDTTPADSEIDRRFNELRRELLDDREKTIDWWLTIIVIFLTFLAIIIPIAAVFGGLFGFKKFNEIKEEAQRHLEEIRKSRAKADSLVKGISAEDAGTNPDKASEAVENVQQNPEASLIDWAVAAALSLQRQGKIENAIEKWRAVALIAEESDNNFAARAWLSVGYLLHSQGKHDLEEIKNVYDKALRLKPDYVEAYYNRGIAQANLGQYEKAIADYNEALRLKPDFTEAYLNRGNALSKLGQHEEALTDYDKALSLKPDLAEAYLNRGVAKADLGKYEKALSDYNEALRLKPNYAEVYYNRGAGRNRLGQHEAAIADFDEALRLKSDFADAYLNRGVAQVKLGQYERAIADFSEALRLQPDYAEAYNNRGKAQNFFGNHDAAIADLNEAIRLKPDLAATYDNRGIAKADLGQHQAAIADFDKAIRLKPDLPQAYDNRGTVKAKLGQYEAAIADYNNAIRLKPDFDGAYYNRGLVKRQLGNIGKAQQDFKKALDLARSTGNADLMKLARSELENLNRGDV